MNIWHDIDPSRITPDDFIAVIEISKGSKTKYELDKELGLLRLDRVLFTSTQYPANYGFIPRTYAGDSDPLDVLVLCSESMQPLTLVRCFPIGIITMMDSDEVDEKIIAVPFRDPIYSSYVSINDVPGHMATEISHFFTVYKHLEQKDTNVSETGDEKAARAAIARSIEEYKKNYYNIINGTGEIH